MTRYVRKLAMQFPACSREKCFANGNHCPEGTCAILTDTNFRKRSGEVKPCPFFKTKKQYEKENRDE